MLIFSFICLYFILLSVIAVLGYLHLQRENKRHWREYSRRAIKQVKALESRIQGQLDVHAGNIKMLSTSKKDTPGGLRAVNPRVASEDRHEREMKEVIVIDGQPVQIPRVA